MFRVFDDEEEFESAIVVPFGGKPFCVALPMWLMPFVTESAAHETWRIFVIRDFHITEKLENEVQNDFIMKEGRARQLQGTANF